MFVGCSEVVNPKLLVSDFVLKLLRYETRCIFTSFRPLQHNLNAAKLKTKKRKQRLSHEFHSRLVSVQIQQTLDPILIPLIDRHPFPIIVVVIDPSTAVQCHKGRSGSLGGGKLKRELVLVVLCSNLC